MNPMGKYTGQGPRPMPGWAQPPQLPQGLQVMPEMDLGQPMAPPPGSMPAPNTPQVSLPAQGPGPAVPPGAGQGQMQANMGGMSWQQNPSPARPFTPQTGPLMADALQARAGTR